VPLQGLNFRPAPVSRPSSPIILGPGVIALRLAHITQLHRRSRSDGAQVTQNSSGLLPLEWPAMSPNNTLCAYPMTVRTLRIYESCILYFILDVKNVNFLILWNNIPSFFKPLNKSSLCFLFYKAFWVFVIFQDRLKS